MDPVATRHWLARGPLPEPDAIAALQQDLGVPELLARLLLGRDLRGDAARQFLQGRLVDLPDPFLLPDMQVAVQRLVQAITADEPIEVHGDYDVDGISGTALLVEGLTAIGARVSYHIPLRLRDGYGLSAAALRNAAANGVRVVISVDCGVSAHDEAALAHELGLSLVITDHHQPPQQLPAAVAVVNPQRRESRFPTRDLAGVGVAFFLLVALRKQLRDEDYFATRPEPDLRQLLDLVALGTIADLVPLQGVNRILTKSGLALLQAGQRPGIKALKQVANVPAVTCGAVGYQLAPRLNAAGRLEDAGRGVELLLEQDLVRALQTARKLDGFNQERRDLERNVFDQAEQRVRELGAQHTHAIVLADEHWHSGVIGIVASRLVERFYRPAVLIALDGESGKGSARSIRGFHLYRGLQDCAETLLAFGGHEMAAGLSLERDQLSAFAAMFEAQARALLAEDDLVPQLRHDGPLTLDELDLPTLRELERLAPFGMGNAEPQLLVEGVSPRQVQVLGEKHLRFTAVQGGYSQPAIAFGMADRRELFRQEVDLLVSPQVNRYRGRETVQLRVRDVRPAAAN